ncbi:hypothetical protein TNCV_99691 [Trichonephila clavipes]|nr:hypothetical protein TNCV_99691 [Trichonephila clavipes]
MKKREIGMARKRAENREGSLEFPGFVTPVFTEDSKTPREIEKITRAPRERETRTHLKKAKIIHSTENPIAPSSVVCLFLYQRKEKPSGFSLTKASLIWDSKNKVIKSGSALAESTLQRRNTLFFLSKHIPNGYLLYVQRSYRSSSSEQWDGNSEDLLPPCPA